MILEPGEADGAANRPRREQHSKIFTGAFGDVRGVSVWAVALSALTGSSVDTEHSRAGAPHHRQGSGPEPTQSEGDTPQEVKKTGTDN